MNKALIVLLVFAVAGGLFAQSFSGQVRTGALFTFSGDFPVKGIRDGNGDQGVFGELVFKNSGDDWGFTISANANVPNNVDSARAGGVYIDGFNGWVTFADIFKLTAGKGVGDEWYWNIGEWSNMQASPGWK